ncbi:MAG: FtsH protease activity modulator HflK [Betaproteobacteria bacterium AqS2]|uniref:Protein HflK n=1 Tax=Candidatus Amphirhobacter heronislandensis TaxID=1732024 RepID=A0A930Y199_9GAMM|nr:FtsH protease activity modulator HflK [Betaproteobacteria bacterium AqS2]
MVTSIILGVLQQQQGEPPDLEELFRKIVQRLRGRRQSQLDAFRRNGSGPNGGEPLNLPMGPIIGIVCAVIVGLVGLSGFYTVEQYERSVTFRFGNPTGVSQPGLRWIMPFFESEERVKLTEVRQLEIGYRGSQTNKVAREALMLTDNLNIIDLQFAVQYLLNNPEDYLYNNRDPESAVLQVAETAMREVVGRSNIDFVLYEGREQIAADTQTLMQEILDRYQTGILIQQVAIQNVQPPDQVQAAFEDAIKARQDRERKINEGEAYANDIVPKARGLSSRILEDAEAYRQQKIALAEGSSQRFINLAEEYEAAPAVTRQRLYLDTIEDVMRRTNKIIVDQGEGSNSLLYLPLDQLLGAAAARQFAPDSGGSLPLGGGDAGNSSSSSWSDLLREDIRRRFEERRAQGGS